MTAVLYALLAVLGGTVQPVQTAMNARTKDVIGSPLFASLCSFIVGTIALAGLWGAGAFGRGDVAKLGSVPWWAWAAGLLGAISVTINVLVVDRIGVAVTIAAAVCGQLVMAVLVDHFGWLGSERIPVSFPRIAGAVLLVVGTLLVQKK